MPLIRVDDEDKKKKSVELENPDDIHQQAIKNTNKKMDKQNSRKRNLYPLWYTLIAIAVFGLGLLVIALMNLAMGNGFTI